MSALNHLPSWMARAVARRATPKRLATALGAALLLCAAGSASAFDFAPPPPPLYQGLMFPMFPNGHTVPFTGQSGKPIRSASRDTARGAAAPAQAGPVIATGASQVQANAQQLAQVAPSAQREQMAKVYVQTFDTWRQLEAKLGLPAGDVAGAVAAFIAGNYMAWRNEEVPDEAFAALAAQMRSALASNAGFANATPTQRRSLYEQMAMVGTFMAVARLSFKQQPNPGAQANFRDAAKANLELALGMPADKLRITEQGLTAR